MTEREIAAEKATNQIYRSALSKLYDLPMLSEADIDWLNKMAFPAPALDYRTLVQGEALSEPMDGVVRPLSKMKTFKVTKATDAVPR